MLRMQQETLLAEVNQVRKILDAWAEKISNGVPDENIGNDGMNEEVFVYLLRGEFQLCAEKLNAIVEVLDG